MVDPGTLGTIANIGFGALGIGKSKKAAKMQRRIGKEDRNVLGTAYEPINFSGLGGAGLTFGGAGGAGGAGGGYGTGGWDGRSGVKKSGRIQDLGGGYRKIGRYTIQSDINNASLNLGALDPVAQQLFGLIPGLADSFGNIQTGQDIINQVPALAFSGLGQLYGAQQQLEGISPYAANAMGGAFANLQDAQANPFQQQAMQGFLGQGQNLLNRAGQGYDQAYSDTLGLLRESARPGEELAGANFLQRMFDTGGRGTSGGALQSQQFAQGLAQADTSRQLQALQEARNRQSQDLNVGQSLYGTGMDIRGMQDELLGTATGRFGRLAELNQGLANDRFNMGTGFADYASQIGNIGMGIHTSPYTNINNLVGALSGLQNFALTPAKFGEQLMQNQANYRTGQAGTGSASIAAPAANAASIYGALSGADLGGLFGKLGGLFGGGGGGTQAQATDITGRGGYQSPYGISTNPGDWNF